MSRGGREREIKMEGGGKRRGEERKGEERKGEERKGEERKGEERKGEEGDKTNRRGTRRNERKHRTVAA